MDVEAAINKLKSVFALSKSTEAYYHILFFIILRFYGADINAEESNSGGRADAVLKVGNHIYVIEFKKGLSADVAIKQIEDKHYADKYILDPMGKTIHLLGITFGEKERNIVDYLDKVVIQ